MEKGKFYTVATPIGNLKDITLRSIEVLQEVDYIACEDTRVTSKLLEKYSISKKLINYFKHNEKQKTSEILELIKSGKSIALVSDAGTPCICDPGCTVVEELYANGITAEIIPGACAVTGFLSAVPREEEDFVFVGFLPRNDAHQQDIFSKYEGINLVFYESANRTLNTIENIIKSRGEDAKIVVGRELTKIYEEVKIDSAKNMLEYYQNNTLKGEIVAMVYANKNYAPEIKEITDKIKKLQAKNFSNKDISVILSELYGLNKNEVYKLTLE